MKDPIKQAAARKAKVPKGRNHYRWSGERMLSNEGYVKLRVGREHPGSRQGTRDLYEVSCCTTKTRIEPTIGSTTSNCCHDLRTSSCTVPTAAAMWRLADLSKNLTCKWRNRMAIMMGKLYSALRAGGVPDNAALEAAEEVAGYENRLSAIETRLAVLTWMVGTVIALLIPLIALLIRVAAKVGAL